MSEIFVYIATESTDDPYVPVTQDTYRLSRDVSDAFVAITGGRRSVGQLQFFPLQRSVPGHLLCDGKEVSKASFPQLYSFLGDTQGTPVNADNFVLPNFIGTAELTPAAVAEPETVVSSTATAPPPTNPTIPAWDEDIYRQWDSGGRPPWYIPPHPV